MGGRHRHDRHSREGRCEGRGDTAEQRPPGLEREHDGEGRQHGRPVQDDVDRVRPGDLRDEGEEADEVTGASMDTSDAGTEVSSAGTASSTTSTTASGTDGGTATSTTMGMSTTTDSATATATTTATSTTTETDGETETDGTMQEHIVFVTSEVYRGNLQGLAGADAKCAFLAEQAGLPGVAGLGIDLHGISPCKRAPGAIA